MEETHVMFMDIPTSKSRSISPLTPSPSREKSHGFFQLLTKRLGRRSQEELVFHSEEDSRSSSTESCSSASGIGRHHKNSKSSLNNMEISCSSSETSNSDSTELDKRNSITNRLHRRSTSSIRRALENITLSTRSSSCSNTPLKEPTKMKKSNSNSINSNGNNKKTPPPKRILRQPVSYAYLKGMSGLPTQRVPRSTVTCCHYAHR